jgi:hypothetical protein
MHKTLKVPEPTTFSLQGLKATAEEYRVGKALEKLGHEYIFQFQLFEISRVRGSFVIDFLVLTTVPLSTPVEVYGEYWHSGQLGAGDRVREIVIQDLLRGSANPLVVFYGSDLQDQQSADEVVKREIGPA